MTAVHRLRKYRCRKCGTENRNAYLKCKDILCPNGTDQGAHYVAIELKKLGKKDKKYITLLVLNFVGWFALIYMGLIQMVKVKEWPSKPHHVWVSK